MGRTCIVPDSYPSLLSLDRIDRAIGEPPSARGFASVAARNDLVRIEMG
ncbi:MAG: hypothetical protein WC489_08160 [Patescibacteria group bacterium]